MQPFLKLQHAAEHFAAHTDFAGSMEVGILAYTEYGLVRAVIAVDWTMDYAAAIVENITMNRMAAAA
jgi:uncharacterized NAD-dependent epimerase/dehydratase family protein